MIRGLVTIHDAVAIALAFVIGTILSLGRPAFEDVGLFRLISDGVLFGVVGALITHIIGLNRAIWRYASLGELRAIAIAVTIIFICSLAVSALVPNHPPLQPESLIVSCLLAGLLLGGTRFGYRLHRNRRARGRHVHEAERTAMLFFGPITEAELHLRRQNEMGLGTGEIVLVIDASASENPGAVRGIPTVSTVEQFETQLQRLASVGQIPSELFVAANVSRKEFDMLRRVIECVDRYGIRLARERGESLTETKSSRSAVNPGLIELGDLAIVPSRRELDFKPSPQADGYAIIGIDEQLGLVLLRNLLERRPKNLIVAGDNERAMAEAARLVRADADGRTSLHSAVGLGRWAQGLRKHLERDRPQLVAMTSLVGDPLRPPPRPEILIRRLLIDFYADLQTVVATGDGRRVVVVAVDRPGADPTALHNRCLRAVEAICLAHDGMNGWRVLPFRTGLVLRGKAAMTFEMAQSLDQRISSIFQNQRMPVFSSEDVAAALVGALELGQRNDLSDRSMLGMDVGTVLTPDELKAWISVLYGFEFERSSQDGSQPEASPVPGGRPEQRSVALFSTSEQPHGSAVPGLVIARGRAPTLDLKELDKRMVEIERRLEAGDMQDVLSLVDEIAGAGDVVAA